MPSCDILDDPTSFQILINQTSMTQTSFR